MIDTLSPCFAPGTSGELDAEIPVGYQTQLNCKNDYFHHFLLILQMGTIDKTMFRKFLVLFFIDFLGFYLFINKNG